MKNHFYKILVSEWYNRKVMGEKWKQNLLL